MVVRQAGAAHNACSITWWLGNQLNCIHLAGAAERFKGRLCDHWHRMPASAVHLQHVARLCA